MNGEKQPFPFFVCKAIPLSIIAKRKDRERRPGNNNSRLLHSLLFLLCPLYLRVTSRITSFPFGGLRKLSPEMRPVEVLLPERFTGYPACSFGAAFKRSLPATIIRLSLFNSYITFPANPILEVRIAPTRLSYHLSPDLKIDFSKPMDKTLTL